VRTIVGSGSAGGNESDDADALAALGIDLEQIRAAADEAFGSGALDRAMLRNGTTIGRIRMAPRVKKVIELALREAIGLGHNYIGTEHLLLAIIAEGEGVAASVLRGECGAAADMRAAVLAKISATA